jgi:vacuolar-type H+-ATPase subunit I/STV1
MILLSALLILPGCRREPKRPAANGTAALMDQVARAPDYRPPADGRLTRRQIGMYLEVQRREQELRKAGTEGATAGLRSARELGYNPKEYAWVRDRVQDAEMLQATQALSRQVAEARRAILARLREQRQTAKSAGERAEIDKQIRELETPAGTDQADPVRQANAALLVEARHGGR